LIAIALTAAAAVRALKEAQEDLLREVAAQAARREVPMAQDQYWDWVRARELRLLAFEKAEELFEAFPPNAVLVEAEVLPDSTPPRGTATPASIKAKVAEMLPKGRQ
jgi:hypothetical protein